MIEKITLIADDIANAPVHFGIGVFTEKINELVDHMNAIEELISNPPQVSLRLDPHCSTSTDYHAEGKEMVR